MTQKPSPGSLSCPPSRRCPPERATRVRPAERLGEGAIEIRDEVQQLRAQIFHRRERTAPDHFPHDHPEDHLDLVQPRTVLASISTEAFLAPQPTLGCSGTPCCVGFPRFSC